jgi:Ni/Fe-hydrogenase subunit HybB-like protein
MWNPHSVMFEVAWCVMLYTAVLALEFGQVVLQRVRLWNVLRITRLALPPLVVAGVLLSTLHQSSLGSLFLIVPGKLHPLWYTPMLPIFFFVSAVAVGLAMVTAEATLSSRAFHHQLNTPLFTDLGRAGAVVLSVYLALRIADLVVRGVWGLLFSGSLESVMYLLELGLGVVLPLALFTVPAVARTIQGVAAAAWLVVGGVVMNRLNVAVTGMLASSGARYVPAWGEMLITASIVSGGILAYIYAVEHLPVFGPEPAPGVPREVVRSASHSVGVTGHLVQGADTAPPP